MLLYVIRRKRSIIKDVFSLGWRNNSTGWQTRSADKRPEFHPGQHVVPRAYNGQSQAPRWEKTLSMPNVPQEKQIKPKETHNLGEGVCLLVFLKTHNLVSLKKKYFL